MREGTPADPMRKRSTVYVSIALGELTLGGPRFASRRRASQSGLGGALGAAALRLGVGQEGQRLFDDPGPIVSVGNVFDTAAGT